MYIGKWSVFGVSCFLSFQTASVVAYSVETHRVLSRAAVSASQSLGSGVRVIYDDFNIDARAAFPDSDRRFRRVKELVGFGAVAEDDFALRRPLNHFFDPQHGGRALTVAGVRLGYPSPDWALEDGAPVSDGWLPPTQLHSLSAAYDYLLKGLTASAESERITQLGSTFQALGHVIHHIQDMAQPQHVRNEPHLSVVDTSYFESWTDGRRTTLPTVGYPIPDLSDFSTARRFWTHGGKGIAEFTAWNFVSNDTNFQGVPGSYKPHSDYPLPAIDRDPPIEKVTFGSLTGSSGAPFASAEIWFIGTQVNDVNAPAYSKFNPRSSTWSLLSPEIERYTGLPFTSLNRFNFSAAHDFLIPRAVAYSAGLIDYFFRGRLAVDSYERSGDTITLKVRNVSAADFALRGWFEDEQPEISLYYDAHDHARRQIELAGGDLGSQSLAVGATRTLSFHLPQDVATDKEKPFMLVFDGRIGEERGIAALALPMPSPRGFLVTPGYVPADGISGRRLIAFDGEQWKLGPQSGLQAGNVDWRGDEPGEVLTWDGPPSRYFYPAAVQGYSTHIYYQGRLLAEAPGNVQGVAVRTDGAQRWLTVAVYAGNEFSLYVRPFRSSYAGHGLYDAQSNPDGWRLLGSHASGLPSTPVFFNSSGTEAQTIVRVGTSTTDRFRQRVKMHVGAGLTVETLSAKGTGTWRKSAVSSYEPAVTVVEGEGDPCSSTPGNFFTKACRRRGRCTAPSGETFDMCLEGQSEFRMDVFKGGRTLLDYTFETPTVVCVDYRGDTEVRCEIVRDVASAETTEFRLRYHQIDKQTTNAACLPVFSGENTSESQGGRMTRISDVRRLRFGGIEIPLTGSESDRVFQEHTTVHQAPQGGEMPSGTATVSGDSTAYDTRILYLDARNDIAVVGMRNRINTVQGSSSGPSRRPQWTYSVATVFSYETKQELLAYAGGQRHTLHAATSDVQSLAGDGSYTSGLGFGGKPDCPPAASSDPGVPQAFTDDFAIDRFLLLNAGGNPAAVTQGYAVDAAGRIAASQTIWVRQPSGAYQQQGTWHFLSNGSLPQLIPPGGNQSAYFPVGVID